MHLGVVTETKEKRIVIGEKKTKRKWFESLIAVFVLHFYRKGIIKYFTNIVFFFAVDFAKLLVKDLCLF